MQVYLFTHWVRPHWNETLLFPRQINPARVNIGPAFRELCPDYPSLQDSRPLPKMNRSFPKSWWRTGLPWRFVLTVRSSSLISSPPVSKVSLWPTNGRAWSVRLSLSLWDLRRVQTTDRQRGPSMKYKTLETTQSSNVMLYRLLTLTWDRLMNSYGQMQIYTWTVCYCCDVMIFRSFVSLCTDVTQVDSNLGKIQIYFTSAGWYINSFMIYLQWFLWEYKISVVFIVI